MHLYRVVLPRRSVTPAENQQSIPRSDKSLEEETATPKDGREESLRRRRVLIMSMLFMVVVLLRFYVDDRMHPGMDTALEIVLSFAESFYRYIVPRVDNRSLRSLTFGKGLQV